MIPQLVLLDLTELVNNQVLREKKDERGDKQMARDRLPFVPSYDIHGLLV